MFSMHAELTTAQQLMLRFLEERSDSGELPPTIREICTHFGYRSTKAASDHLSALQKKGFVARDKRCARGLRLVQRKTGIPLLGRIQAGNPRDTEAEPAERLTLNPEHYGIRNRSRAFALRVSGDSMIGRQLFDGDIVLLESAAEPHNGDIVAALIDHQSTLKTLVLRSGKAWLRAENSKYPDLIPAWDLQIQGIARAVIRYLRK
jgi:repressor LexA